MILQGKLNSGFELSGSPGVQLSLAIDDFVAKVMWLDAELKPVWDISPDAPNRGELIRRYKASQKFVFAVHPTYGTVKLKLQEAQKWLYQMVGPKNCKIITEAIDTLTSDLMGELFIFCPLTDSYTSNETFKRLVGRKRDYDSSISEIQKLIYDINKELKRHIESQEPEETAQKKVILTDTEQNILEALGDRTMHGPDLLKKAGYDNSSHYRAILSNLTKRDVLGRNSEGYYKKK